MQKLERPLKILIQKINKRSQKKINKNEELQKVYFFFV